MPGKRVQIDAESWAVLDLLARDRMMTFQELADEAFADLLKKHGRPVDLRAALRQSARKSAEVIPFRRASPPTSTRKHETKSSKPEQKTPGPKKPKLQKSKSKSKRKKARK
jgi:hypothetical protein